MRKKTLTILFTVGTVLSFLAVIAEIPMIEWVVQCSNTRDVCDNPSHLTFIGLALAALLILAGSVLLIIAAIDILIKQAKQKQWGWFVCTLLFSWITMLIYLIKVPEREQPAMTVPRPW